MNEDKRLDRDIVPDEDSNDKGQGQPPASDSAEPQQPKLDIELEHTLKEATTETERGEPTTSPDKVETNHVLSFRGPMGASEPQHGLCTITDHRRNGYVRKGDRGPWIRIDSPKAPALIAGAVYETR